MRRSLVALLTCMLTFVLATPVGAAPERVHMIDDRRFQYDCGGVLLTEDGGHYEVRMTLHELEDGRFQTTFVATAHDVTASDTDGNAYEISGSGSGTAMWPSREDFEAGELPTHGQFGVRLTIRHADGGGKFGQVWVRFQAGPDGEIVMDRGDCEDLGPAA